MEYRWEKSGSQYFLTFRVDGKERRLRFQENEITFAFMRFLDGGKKFMEKDGKKICSVCGGEIINNYCQGCGLEIKND